MHTVSHNGRSYDVQGRSHVDDHPNDDSWLKAHSREISALTGVASLAISAATFAITHKPRR